MAPAGEPFPGPPPLRDVGLRAPPEPRPSAPDPIPWTGILSAVWILGSGAWFSLAAARTRRLHRALASAAPAPVELAAEARTLAAIAPHLPRWQDHDGLALSTIDFCYWYYGTLALSQIGGEDWERWRPEAERALSRSQRAGPGDEAGSWDPIDEWGPVGGRVYATALGALTLQACRPGDG